MSIYKTTNCESISLTTHSFFGSQPAPQNIDSQALAQVQALYEAIHILHLSGTATERKNANKRCWHLKVVPLRIYFPNPS